MTTADRSLRVFVNAAAVDVPAGSTALEAVRAWDAREAEAVSRGERVITDSRGLPVTVDVEVHAGSIFRLVSGRKEREPAARAPGAGDDL